MYTGLLGWALYLLATIGLFTGLPAAQRAAKRTGSMRVAWAWGLCMVLTFAVGTVCRYVGANWHLING